VDISPKNGTSEQLKLEFRSVPLSWEYEYVNFYITVYRQHQQWFWWKPSVFHRRYSSSWCRRCMRVSTTPPAERNYSSPESSLTSARAQNTPTRPGLSHTDHTVGSFLCHPWNARSVHQAEFTVHSHYVTMAKERMILEMGYKNSWN
jgi:hypothetical protein